jgi:hypothetical protein
MRHDTEFYVPADGWSVCGKRLARYCTGGGGGQQTSSTNTTVNYSPEEAAARAAVQAQAKQIYDANATSLSAAGYPGSKPVQFSPESTQAQGMLSNYATGAGARQAAQAGSYSSFLMGPAQYAESNPYMQSAMSAAIRPITQAYTDPGGVMSQIRTNSVNNGMLGSSRDEISQNIAGRGYMDAVADTTSKMAYQNYSDASKVGAQALALSPQTFSLGTQPAVALSGVGTQKENMGQAGEDYAAASRMWNLNAPWTPLQNYANIVFGGATPGTSSTATAQGPQRNQLLSALGGAASGAALGSAIFPGMGTMIGGGLGLLAGFL